jgi:hypothetical protein
MDGQAEAERVRIKEPSHALLCEKHMKSNKSSTDWLTDWQRVSLPQLPFFWFIMLISCYWNQTLPLKPMPSHSETPRTVIIIYINKVTCLRQRNLRCFITVCTLTGKLQYFGGKFDSFFSVVFSCGYIVYKILENWKTSKIIDHSAFFPWLH